MQTVKQYACQYLHAELYILYFLHVHAGQQVNSAGNELKDKFCLIKINYARFYAKDLKTCLCGGKFKIK